MHSLKVTYRPDEYPEWLPWIEFSQRFELIGTPQAIDAGGVPTARAGFAPRISFGKPPDKTDDTTKRNLRRGYQFQVRFQGIGHVVIDKFRIHAQKLIENSKANLNG